MRLNLLNPLAKHHGLNLRLNRGLPKDSEALEVVKVQQVEVVQNLEPMKEPVEVVQTGESEAEGVLDR
jgi:hypothetical protein